MVESPVRSPMAEPAGSAAVEHTPPPSSLPPPPHNTPQSSHPPSPPLTLALATISSHAALHEPPRAAAIESSSWFPWTGANSTTTEPDHESSDVTGIVRRNRNAAAVQRAAIAARTAAALLCLIAISVLGADRRKGWALDSYDRYRQLRYQEALNVIGFVYSAFQLYSQLHNLQKGKHLIPRPEGDYFNFAMDQVMAYLLISAASSATAQTSDWEVNWGTDPFPNMANGSIAMSFLAFLAFAACSLISAYNLFGQNHAF